MLGKIHSGYQLVEFGKLCETICTHIVAHIITTVVTQQDLRYDYQKFC